MRIKLSMTRPTKGEPLPKKLTAKRISCGATSSTPEDEGEIVIAEIFGHAEFNLYVYFPNKRANSRIRPDGTMQAMRMQREKRARAEGTFTANGSMIAAQHRCWQ